MNIEFSMAGFEVLSGKLDTWNAQVEQVTARSMNESAERTMARSKNEYVPVDTGTLRSSGMVQTTVNGRVIETTLSYGGAASQYAVFVHEMNKNYHNGKSCKYLEIPLKEDLPEYNRKLAADLQNMLEGG